MLAQSMCQLMFLNGLNFFIFVCIIFLQGAIPSSSEWILMNSPYYPYLPIWFSSFVKGFQKISE
jgi:hypothetical protein